MPLSTPSAPKADLPGSLLIDLRNLVASHEAEDFTASDLKRAFLKLPSQIPKCPDHAQLESVAQALARTVGRNWTNLVGPMALDSACPWMREVHAGQDDGASLYLNSEPPGASDIPHEHGTWAVLVGLEGAGCNTIFEMVDIRQRHVRKLAQRIVTPGDIVVLEADAIHALDAHGNLPFVSLNLYGSPISSRPSFQQRSYHRCS